MKKTRRSKRLKSTSGDLDSAEWGVNHAKDDLQNLQTTKIDNQQKAYELLGALFHLTQSYQGLLLTYWRLGDKKRVQALVADLLETASMELGTIAKFRLEPIMYNAWPSFGRAALFSFLLESEFRTEFLDLCKVKSSSRITEQLCYVIADMNLALTIANGKKIRGYDDFLETYFCNRHKTLVADTYWSYGELVNAASKGKLTETEGLIGQCEQNYSKRADDKSYKYFGVEDGTARFNEQQIDFRLATIVKWAYREFPTERKALKTIHQWHFDNQC